MNSHTRDLGCAKTLELLNFSKPLEPLYHFFLKSSTGANGRVFLRRQVSAGTYVGSIRLARPLDFDTVSSYKLSVRAADGGSKTVLASTANVSVVVKDVQDERPVFTNSPYSIVIDENTPAGVQVLKVTAEDGDAGHKRPVVLSVEDDTLGYFAIENESNGTAYVYTTARMIDRENKMISDAGGVYTFRLKVTENRYLRSFARAYNTYTRMEPWLQGADPPGRY